MQIVIDLASLAMPELTRVQLWGRRILLICKSLADLDDVAGALEPLDAEFYRYLEPLTDLVNAYLVRDPSSNRRRNP